VRATVNKVIEWVLPEHEDRTSQSSEVTIPSSYWAGPEFKGRPGDQPNLTDILRNFPSEKYRDSTINWSRFFHVLSHLEYINRPIIRRHIANVKRFFNGNEHVSCNNTISITPPIFFRAYTSRFELYEVALQHSTVLRWHSASFIVINLIFLYPIHIHIHNTSLCSYH
jgi:hypothetical protein